MEPGTYSPHTISGSEVWELGFACNEPVPDFDVIAPALDFDFVVPALDFGFVEVANVGLVLGLVDVYKVELGFGVAGLYLAVGLGLDVGLGFGLRFVDVVEVASASSTCIIFLPLFCMFSRLLRRSSFPPHTPLDAQPTLTITYFFSIRILIRSCAFPAVRGLVAPHTSHESNLLPWGRVCAETGALGIGLRGERKKDCQRGGYVRTPTLTVCPKGSRTVPARARILRYHRHAGQGSDRLCCQCRRKICGSGCCAVSGRG